MREAWTLEVILAISLNVEICGRSCIQIHSVLFAIEQSGLKAALKSSTAFPDF